MNAQLPLDHLTVSSVVVLNDHGWINGGQAKVAIESALQLRRLGLDVCFIAGTGPIDERLEKAGVDCRIVGPHELLSDPNRVRAATLNIWNPAAARVLRKCLAERDPKSTVIHVHGFEKALSPSIGPVLATAGAAHVYTLHGYYLACPNGGFYDFQAQQICKRKPLGLSCLTTHCDARARHHKVWRVARQMALWTAGGLPGSLRELIYIAPEQRDILGPYMPAEARWHYLPNAAGDQPLQRVKAEENDLFLFIGRLSREKGAVVAAEAAKRAGVRIAFCGSGEEESAVRAANPEAQMLGWLSQDQISDWMRRARCIVFPSLWYECYPLVVADALRAGLPLLVSDTSLAVSSVPHEVAGQHVRTGDVQHWADAMRSMCSDALVQSYSRGAFAAGQDLLDPEQYINRLVGIYGSALLRKHRRLVREGVRA